MALLPTVLIVDDDPAIRKMLVEVLQLEGYPIEPLAMAARRSTCWLGAAHGSSCSTCSMPVLNGREMMEECARIPRSGHATRSSSSRPFIT